MAFVGASRIRLISADLRRGGGLKAAVGRARLDRYTSAGDRSHVRDRLYHFQLHTKLTLPSLQDFGDLLFA